MSQLQPQSAATPTGLGPFRFSLQGLLITITFMAIGLAVTNWRMWDADERWILRCWFAGSLSLAVLDRMRGSLGILAATIGGGIPPALITLHLWQNPSRYSLPTRSWMAELGHDSVLMVLFTGALAGALAAGACCIARKWPRSFALATVVVFVVLAANGPSWTNRARDWVRAARRRDDVARTVARLPFVRHLALDRQAEAVPL